MINLPFRINTCNFTCLATIIFLFVLAQSGCSKDEDYTFKIKVIMLESRVPVPNILVRVSEVEQQFFSSKVLKSYSGITDQNGECVLPIRFHRYDHISYNFEINQKYTNPDDGKQHYFNKFKFLTEEDFKNGLVIAVN